MKYEDNLLAIPISSFNDSPGRQSKQHLQHENFSGKKGMVHCMRVLDVGSGTGDVAFVAADLAAPAGEVIGTDIASAAIAAARDGASARGLTGHSGVQIVNAVAWMYRAFVGAGLKPPTMRMRTMVGDAVEVEDWLRSVEDFAVTMLPAIEKFGIATSADAEIDTLSGRIVQEVASGGGIVIGRAEIGAWSRV